RHLSASLEKSIIVRFHWFSPICPKIDGQPKIAQISRRMKPRPQKAIDCRVPPEVGAAVPPKRTPFRAPRAASQPRGILSKGRRQDDRKNRNTCREWQRDKGFWPDGEIDRTA